MVTKVTLCFKPIYEGPCPCGCGYQTCVKKYREQYQLKKNEPVQLQKREDGSETNNSDRREDRDVQL